ncbi:uncharacterized protein [Solanum lycopersicum]|uniref:DUF4408 domain-containing protein n=1 Tax=Solanum lycopersicum TaxID=4081 RepID=A0A3Q7H899_SOLLC|nr:uncharacterized protein LOC101244302 [Solanum lycopersicum]
MGVMIEYVLSWFTPTVLFCVLNLAIATLLITSTFRNTSNDKKQEASEDQLPTTPSLLQRVSPSLLQRVRSINFSFSSQKPTPPFPSLDEQQVEDLKCHVTRSKSVTCAEEEKKVGNHHRRGGGGGRKLFRDEEEDAVDKKADDFINKFREELKMQRLQSMEMLNRGVSI